MLLDPTAQQIGVGGLVAVLMTAAVLKFLPAFMRALKEQNGNSKHDKPLSTAELKNEMRLAVKDMLTDTAPKRHEDLRNLMQGVFEHEFSRRNESLRDMMKEVIGDWADIRFGKGRGSRR